MAHSLRPVLVWKHLQDYVSKSFDPFEEFSSRSEGTRSAFPHLLKELTEVLGPKHLRLPTSGSENTRQPAPGRVAFLKIAPKWNRHSKTVHLRFSPLLSKWCFPCLSRWHLPTFSRRLICKKILVLVLCIDVGLIQHKTPENKKLYATAHIVLHCFKTKWLKSSRDATILIVSSHQYNFKLVQM